MKKILCLFFLLLSFQLAAQDISSWSSPTQLSTSGVNASNPSVASDTNGDSVAVWVESGIVKAAYMPSGGSWGSSTSISGSSASTPQIVMDPSGNATAIWAQSGAIKAATLPFGGSWSSATTLASSGSSAPQLGVDSSGDVVAVWVGPSGAIQSSTKLFGFGWSGTPTTLFSSGGDSPQVSVSPIGNVVAVWHTVIVATTTDAIYAATNTVGGTWAAASPISDQTVDSAYPHVAVADSGEAVAIWFTFDVTGSVYSKVLATVSVLQDFFWSTPQAISNPGIHNPANLVAQVAFNSNSDAIAVWTHSFDSETFHVQSSTLDHTTSVWINPADIAIDLYAQYLDLSVTSTGECFVVYTIFDTPSSSVVIQASISNLGTLEEEFWSTPTNISVNTGNAFPSIAATISGGINNFATVVWLTFDGTNNLVHSSTGTGTALSPPTSLSVVQNSNNFGVFTEYFNTISWTLSSDMRVSGYLIYRNGIIENEVSGSTTSFVDHNVVQTGPVTYGIASFDGDGNQSPTVNINYP